jgi:hypothetical protein
MAPLDVPQAVHVARLLRATAATEGGPDLAASRTVMRRQIRAALSSAGVPAGLIDQLLGHASDTLEREVLDYAEGGERS